MRKPYFIYSYSLPDLTAIKVGYGENPYQRMISYTQKYNITPNTSSLQKWEMPSSGIASNIEKSCHEALIKSGFNRVQLFNDDSEANEVFDLHDFSYEDAVSLIVEDIDENINFIRKSLEGKNFGEKYKKTKKSDELKEKKKERDENIVKQIMSEISEGYDKHYKQYIQAMSAYIKHIETCDYKELGFIERFTKKQKNQCEQDLEWVGFEKSIDLVGPVLKTSRLARTFFHHIHSKYDYDLIDAAQERLNIDLYNIDLPTGKRSPRYSEFTYSLPIPYKGIVAIAANDKNDVERYGGKIDMAVYEVFGCIEMDGGCRYKLIKENIKLQSLVKWARENPPPEMDLELGYKL